MSTDQTTTAPDETDRLKARIAELEQTVADLESTVASLRDTDGMDEQDVVDRVRARLTEQYDDDENLINIIGVVFTPDEWDDGTYLDGENGRVYFADGSSEDVDGFGISDDLTGEYHRVGSKAAFGVRLADNTTEYDDYAGTVYAWLGVKDEG
jgi:uncharacterized coiled-coil protein SlyX